MAINLDSIKNRLNTIQNQTTEKSSKKYGDELLKLQPGKQTVRIVPYVHNMENPFIELLFHFGFNKRTYLSPLTYGNADPIAELGKKIQQNANGNKDEWKIGKGLEPKMRVYAPVIVRGKEEEGVKFWGFGTEIYTELMSYMVDPDYGDITDPLNGRDIVIDVLMPKETGKQHPTPTIRIKPNQSKLSEDKNILELVKNQKNIKEIFQEPTYDELKAAVEKWTSQDESESEISSNYQSNTVSQSTVSTNSTKSELENAFKSLFNSDEE